MSNIIRSLFVLTTLCTLCMTIPACDELPIDTDEAQLEEEFAEEADADVAEAEGLPLADAPDAPDAPDAQDAPSEHTLDTLASGIDAPEEHLKKVCVTRKQCNTTCTAGCNDNVNCVANCNAACSSKPTTCDEQP